MTARVDQFFSKDTVTDINIYRGKKGRSLVTANTDSVEVKSCSLSAIYEVYNYHDDVARIRTSLPPQNT